MQFYNRGLRFVLTVRERITFPKGEGAAWVLWFMKYRQRDLQQTDKRNWRCLKCLSPKTSPKMLSTLKSEVIKKLKSRFCLLFFSPLTLDLVRLFQVQTYWTTR